MFVIDHCGLLEVLLIASLGQVIPVVLRWLAFDVDRRIRTEYGGIKDRPPGGSMWGRQLGVMGSANHRAAIWSGTTQPEPCSPGTLAPTLTEGIMSRFSFVSFHWPMFTNFCSLLSSEGDI